MIPSDQQEQSGRAIILIVALVLLITLGAGLAFVARVLMAETPARHSSLPGAGDSSPGGSLPPPARAAT